VTRHGLSTASNGPGEGTLDLGSALATFVGEDSSGTAGGSRTSPSQRHVESVKVLLAATFSVPPARIALHQRSWIVAASPPGRLPVATSAATGRALLIPQHKPSSCELPPQLPQSTRTRGSNNQSGYTRHGHGPALLRLGLFVAGRREAVK